MIGPFYLTNVGVIQQFDKISHLPHFFLSWYHACLVGQILIGLPADKFSYKDFKVILTTYQHADFVE